MSNDSRFVLAQLTRSGIWSKWSNLLRYKHLVLEADSVVIYLYQYCVNKHIQRQRGLLSGGRSSSSSSSASSTTIDYYSATLVNYEELANLIDQLLDYFAHYSIELIIVYRGKHMEAPLFGLGPAQFKKNTQRTSESLMAMLDYEHSLKQEQQQQQDASAGRQPPRREHKVTLDRMRPTRPQLALNLFKQIVNSRQKAAGGEASRSASPQSPAQSGAKSPTISATRQTTGGIQSHQAFYCPYPTCARLARDYKCPVMTNDGDFVVMDVRAGFILFEEFFVNQILTNGNSVLRHPSSSGSSIVAPSMSATGSLGSSSSMARNQLLPGPAGRGGVSSPGPVKSPGMIDLTSSKSLFQERRHAGVGRGRSKSLGSMPSSPRAQGAPPKAQIVMLRFSYHRLFLAQHPGLNSALALQLFPLTSGEFLIQYANSLVRLRIYEREFHERDLIVATVDQKSFKKYHQAAGRLELAMHFLCAKNPDTAPNLIRGEASRLGGSPIEQDYQGLYNYYAVSYHFKGRLRLILRQSPIPLDWHQLDHIETSLIGRECTADFWLSLLCCSLGRMASVDYNKPMQSEDLQTKHSARSMLDRPKSLMMRLLRGNKEDDKTLDKTKPAAPKMTSGQRRKQQQQQETTRGPSTPQKASLTVIDRQGRQLIERTILPLSTGSSHNSSDTTQTQQPTLSQKQQAQFNHLRERLSLAQLSGHNKGSGAPVSASQHQSPASATTTHAAAALMNLVFNSSGDMTKLCSLIQPKAMKTGAPAVASTITGSNLLASAELLQKHQDHPPKVVKQLAILLALHRYSLNQAMRDDQYFIKNYLSLGQHFEAGLVNQHLYKTSSSSSSSSPVGQSAGTTSVSAELRQLFDLVHRYDMERVTNLPGLLDGFERGSHQDHGRAAPAKPKAGGGGTSKLAPPVGGKHKLVGSKDSLPTKSTISTGSETTHSTIPTTTTTTTVMINNQPVTKLIRHLIELLSSSIEAYCELNAFLNYPLPQLQLRHYNPILLFNLTLASYLSGSLKLTPRVSPRLHTKKTTPTSTTATKKKA